MTYLKKHRIEELLAGLHMTAEEAFYILAQTLTKSHLRTRDENIRTGAQTPTILQAVNLAVRNEIILNRDVDDAAEQSRVDELLLTLCYYAESDQITEMRNEPPRPVYEAPPRTKPKKRKSKRK